MVKAGQSAPSSAHKFVHRFVIPGDAASKVNGTCCAVLKKWPVVFSNVNNPLSHVPKMNESIMHENNRPQSHQILRALNRTHH